MRMTLAVQAINLSSEPTPNPPPTIYDLRRSDGAAWEAKLTEASRRAAIAELDEELKTPTPLRMLQERREKQRSDLERPPEWTAIRDDLAGPLESQFQRFTRQYSG